MPEIIWVRNDKFFFQEFEVKDVEGEIVDLTGTTVRLKVQRYGESTLLIDKAGEVTDGPDGICRFLIEDEIQGISGEFHAEIEVTWPSGKILTVPDIYIQILKDLPR